MASIARTKRKPGVFDMRTEVAIAGNANGVVALLQVLSQSDKGKGISGTTKRH